MKNAVFVAGAAAAFLIVAPGAALAATSTTPAKPAEPTTTAPEYPDGPMTRVTRQLTVAPAKAKPGTHVTLDFHCQTRGPDENVTVRSAALAFGKPGNWGDGTVKDVKPGKYTVTLHCGPETSTASLEVLAAKKPGPKQVVKVPSGAPQTGGTDGPADGSGAPLAAAAAMGALALGGSGLVLARRARRR
ncbi:hypothetical protein [Amycolatopsis sp. cmx-4-68]|uniref:hypothetical protein n=1 Tax=Amycolatopsis sp. cmx-4-68 TaxID=2790938 RepID=UPI0039788D49